MGDEICIDSVIIVGLRIVIELGSCLQISLQISLRIVFKTLMNCNQMSYVLLVLFICVEIDDFGERVVLGISNLTKMLDL